MTALVIADIARRSADETRHCVLFHVFRHIDANHRLLIVKHEFGQSPRQFGFADAGRPQENKRANGAVGILQAGARAPERSGHRLDAFVLTDHPHLESFIHMNEFLHIAFHHASQWNTCPVGNHFRHVFSVHFFLEHLIVLLSFFQFFLFVLKLLIQCHQLAVTDFCGAGEITFALGINFFGFQCFHLTLDLLNFFNDIFFRRPVHLHLIHAGFRFGQFLFNLFTSFFCGFIRFLFQGLLLNFQLDDLPLNSIYFTRHAVELNTQSRRGFINQVHRLVRQKPVGNIAVRKRCGSNDGRILDSHTMMHFITLLEAA